MIRALALALLLSGCAVSKSCFVGFSLLPPGPIVVCGLDATPPETSK